MSENAVEPPVGFPREAWPAYSRWVRAGDRSTRSVWPLVKEAFAAGARAEAECRTEDRAAAALEVCDLVDGFGQWPELADEDEAHFVGLAAAVYFAGQPWRRRLALAWRLVRPPRWWVGYAESRGCS